ncbi:MAG: fibronectin type III domain-containing protein [Oscillospiraceae bacterium]
MLNFNTKKEMLRRLRAKRERNRLLWLPCVIAELFVKLWYAVLCTVDMALSDKHGNFLGMKREEKLRTRRQDDIVYVKKPFFGRLLSAVLAASFVMMIVPVADLTVFADDDGDGYWRLNELQLATCVDDTNSYYFDKNDYALAKIAAVTSLNANFANGSAELSWRAPAGFESNRSCSYIVGYSTDTVSDVIINDKYSGTTMLLQNLADDTTYTFFVIPCISLSTYVQAYTTDPNTGAQVPVQDDSGNNLYYSNGTKRVEGKKSFAAPGQPNGKITPAVSIESAEYDERNGEVVLKWFHTSRDNITGALPYGYVIYRTEISYSGSSTEKYEMLDYISADSHVDDPNASSAVSGSTIVYRDNTIKYGKIYKYYVKAYRNLFTGNQYEDNKPGIITSGDETTTTGKKTVSIPPAKITDFTVTSNEKDTLEVEWKAPRNSNVDGYYLFRSETEFSESDITSIVDSSGNPVYFNEETNSWMFYKYIMDMEAQGKAKQLSPNSDNTYTDKYDAKRNPLVNDKAYYYYIFPYVDADRSGAKKLYGPVSSTMGMINAVLGQPSNLTVSTVDGKVTLEWKKVSNASGYRIYIEKLKNYDNSTAGLGDCGYIDVGDVTKYTIENLMNGDQYSYRIKAYTNVASDNTEDPTKLFSNFSDSRVVTVGTELATPTDFELTTQDGLIKINWSAVKDADGYDLYYRQGSGEWKCFSSLSKPGYTHKPLKNNDTYTYYVIAYKIVDNGFNQRVESAPTSEKSITVGEKLGIPQDLKLSTKDGMIQVDWSKVDGAHGYILYFQKQNGAWQQIDLSKPGFTHTGLANGDYYSYYVIAYKDVSDERVYSQESITVSIIVGDKLDSPKDFAAVTTDGKVDLSWSKSNGAEGYILYAYSGGRTLQFDVSKTKYQHTGLSNGDIWTYYLVAYKTVNGVRTYSDPTKSITVTIGISLNAAIDLIATAGNRQIDLSWSKVTGAEGYVVYLYNTQTMEFEPITVTSQTKYSHIGLKNGQKYTYMIAPFKTINGERYYGEYSIAVSAIPTAGSTTDVDRTLNVKGTTPYGISHSEYISAKANHDAFDESVDVYFTTNKESTNAVKEVLKHYADGLSSFIIYPFDISIYKEGTLIETAPNDGYSVTITMPIPDKLIAYRDYITVVHINDNPDVEEITEVEWFESSDQRLEVLPCAIVDIDNVWCVQFKCTSFSPYAIVIYKDHINDVSAGGGVADGSFAGTFNSGLLLFTALPDIMPNNRKLKVVHGGKKRYRIKSVDKM